MIFSPPSPRGRNIIHVEIKFEIKFRPINIPDFARDILDNRLTIKDLLFVDLPSKEEGDFFLFFFREIFRSVELS